MKPLLRQKLVLLNDKQFYTINGTRDLCASFVKKMLGRTPEKIKVTLLNSKWRNPIIVPTYKHITRMSIRYNIDNIFSRWRYTIGTKDIRRTKGRFMPSMHNFLDKKLKYLFPTGGVITDFYLQIEEVK